MSSAAALLNRARAKRGSFSRARVKQVRASSMRREPGEADALAVPGPVVARVEPERLVVTRDRLLEGARGVFRLSLLDPRRGVVGRPLDGLVEARRRLLLAPEGPEAVSASQPERGVVGPRLQRLIERVQRFGRRGPGRAGRARRPPGRPRREGTAPSRAWAESQVDGAAAGGSVGMACFRLSSSACSLVSAR